jgi:hypothetical protein
MTARYRRPATVAAMETTGMDGSPVVFVAPLPNGPVAELERSAALIWLEAVSPSDEDIASRVARRSGVPADAIADDVTAFVDELVQRGLLAPPDQES